MREKSTNNNLMTNKSSVEPLEAINYMTALNCASNLLIFPMRWREKNYTNNEISSSSGGCGGDGNNPRDSPNLSHQNWMCVIEFHILSQRVRKRDEKKSHQEIESGLMNQIIGCCLKSNQINWTEFRLWLECMQKMFLFWLKWMYIVQIEFGAENLGASKRNLKQNQINPKFM